MELVWKLDQQEIDRLQSFVNGQRDNAFVQYRILNNLENPPTAVDIKTFWQVSVGCLLSSQQRSGPDEAVSRFLKTEPFPLDISFYQDNSAPLETGQVVLQSFGGIRFYRRIAEQLAHNSQALEDGLWTPTEAALEVLIGKDSPEAEREAAEFIRSHYKGFGPKQSRNLLQGLGLTKYEIPIDSRIIKWLNRFGFPIVVSATALSDAYYYNFVSDGIQEMCKQSDIVPCILDAAIFSSFDGDGWNEENVVW